MTETNNALEESEAEKEWDELVACGMCNDSFNHLENTILTLIEE